MCYSKDFVIRGLGGLYRFKIIDRLLPKLNNDLDANSLD